MKTLSRMIECDQCGEGVPDAVMRQIYHMENGEEVIDAIVHAGCEDLWIHMAAVSNEGRFENA